MNFDRAKITRKCTLSCNPRALQSRQHRSSLRNIQGCHMCELRVPSYILNKRLQMPAVYVQPVEQLVPGGML